MRCEPFQDAISARIDGEEPGLPERDLDDHLAGCSSCRAFERAAGQIHRRVRVRAAESVPDLSDAILAAAGPPKRRPAAAGAREWARYVLLGVALVQLVVAVPSFVLGDQSGASIHIARELGGWDVAVGVAWLVVAFSPRRAAGLLPFATALAFVMLFTGLLDVLDGRVPVLSEAHHVLDLVGLAMIWVLAQGAPSRRPLLPFRVVRSTPA